MGIDELGRDSIVGGAYRTTYYDVPADAYHKGMGLAYDAAGKSYKYNAVAPSVISAETRTLKGSGKLICYTTGSVLRRDLLVNDQGGKLAPDSDYVESLRANGILAK